MDAKTLHLSYLGLVSLLILTVLLTFPFSMYLFATMKALIILFFFMHLSKSEHASKLYIFIGLALLGVTIGGVMDDVVFRGAPFQVIK